MLGCFLTCFGVSVLPREAWCLNQFTEIVREGMKSWMTLTISGMLDEEHDCITCGNDLCFLEPA